MQLSPTSCRFMYLPSTHTPSTLFPKTLSLCKQHNIMYDLRFSRRWLWKMASFEMLHRVALVRTDVSEELSASFMKVTRMGELGTTPRPPHPHRLYNSNYTWRRIQIMKIINISQTQIACYTQNHTINCISGCRRGYTSFCLSRALVHDEL
jgi:hypothetical protein